MKNIPHLTPSFTAVADCSNTVMVPVPGPVLISAILNGSGSDTKTIVRPPQFTSKKAREAVVKLIRHLSGHHQDPLDDLFGGDKTVPTSGDRPGIFIHLDGDGNTNVTDKLFGQFWSYLRRKGDCTGTRKNLELFIQAYFSSRGEFKGIYRYLCSTSKWNVHTAGKNPLIAAYDLLLQGKEIKMISSDKVVSH